MKDLKQASGFDVLFNPALNKGTAFTVAERDITYVGCYLQVYPILMFS